MVFLMCLVKLLLHSEGRSSRWRHAPGADCHLGSGEFLFSFESFCLFLQSSLELGIVIIRIDLNRVGGEEAISLLTIETEGIIVIVGVGHGRDDRWCSCGETDGRCRMVTVGVRKPIDVA